MSEFSADAYILILTENNHSSLTKRFSKGNIAISATNPSG
jgi:hypothetical protein